jgi:hypothetical protein
MRGRGRPIDSGTGREYSVGARWATPERHWRRIGQEGLVQPETADWQKNRHAAGMTYRTDRDIAQHPSLAVDGMVRQPGGAAAAARVLGPAGVRAHGDHPLLGHLIRLSAGMEAALGPCGR